MKDIFYILLNVFRKITNKSRRNFLLMKVGIQVEGLFYGYVEMWEEMEKKEFIQNVRELTQLEGLLLKEDLDLPSLIAKEVIDFYLCPKFFKKKHLLSIRKYNALSFVRNEDPFLLNIFLSLFDINQAEGIEKWTALIYSSAKGNIEMVKLLVESGANLEIKDNEGMTALNNASKRGHKEVVEFLIARGADVER